MKVTKSEDSIRFMRVTRFVVSTHYTEPGGKGQGVSTAQKPPCQQTFDYWLNLVPHRPPYVVLCNFDEFWIYDFNTQLYEPVDRVPVAELPARHAALNFLFPRAFQPLFGHNWVEVTREAAKDVANAFNSLVFRGEDRVRARRFILQCVVAMFAEDIGLLANSRLTGKIGLASLDSAATIRA